MLDFEKLNDPAQRELAEATRKKEEAEQREAEKRISDAMTLCERNEDALTAIESEFIRSLRRSITRYFKPPSAKQRDWLFDIAARFVPAEERAAIELRAKGDMASLRRSTEINDMDLHADALCALKEGMRDSVIYASIVNGDAEIRMLIATERRPQLA